MTDTTTNQPERGTTAEEAQQPPQGTLEHLDPHALALETNVRDDAALDADFVASVKEHGVMNPIVAVRGSDGVVRVRAGQRRTLAARESGLATIPVYVRQVADGDEQAQVVERVAEQIVENDQRQALTDAQRVRGIQQMLDAGVPVTKVAKTLSISRDIVKSAATAAGSAAAMEALNAGQLSLAEAAALTEFNDDPDAVARLLEVAGTGWFEHKVAEIRNQRESDKAYAQAAEQFAAQGYTVLDQYPRYGDTSRVELRYLRTPDGAATTDEAITDPAHWAVYLSEDTAYADKETGELIDGDDIDWHCRFNGSGESDEGMRHPNSVTERVVFEPEWFCIDYAAAGLELCDILAKRAQAIARENAGGAGNDDDQDAETRAAAQAEAERRERRKVIALNKLGDAAQQVRRQFIAEKLLICVGDPCKGGDPLVVSVVWPRSGPCAWGGGGGAGVKVERPQRSEDERP